MIAMFLTVNLIYNQINISNRDIGIQRLIRL